MKTKLIPLGLAITWLATQASFADYIQATTNLYAPGAGTNFVDSSATLAPNDLATFSNALYSAYAENLARGLSFSSDLQPAQLSSRAPTAPMALDGSP